MYPLCYGMYQMYQQAVTKSLVIGYPKPIRGKFLSKSNFTRENAVLQTQYMKLAHSVIGSCRQLSLVFFWYFLTCDSCSLNWLRMKLSTVVFVAFVVV